MHIKPKKRLGQNFLVDRNIRRKMVAACALSACDTVLEIGSGSGEMTEILADSAARVFALEIDPSLCALLKEKLGAKSNVHIINQDVLKFDFAEFLAQRCASVKVVGNIPYYISSPIIERLFECRSGIADIFLTVQKEFAERLAATPGTSEYSSLSVFAQYHSRPKILFTVKRTCFYPVPKVDSAFIRLAPGAVFERLPEDEPYFFKVVRSAFGKRRKTLRNSLYGVVSREKLDNFFKSRKISPDSRPQELTPQDLIDLSNL